MSEGDRRGPGAAAPSAHEPRAVLAQLVRDAARYEEAVTELVQIPSVSTDPAHADDLRRAAAWVAERLRAAGDVEVETVDVGRHPAVLGRWDGRPGAPTVLVYGHVDVQPPDPLDAWHSPPFELTKRDGRWYARGVSDDKASMLIPILVAEAYFAHGGPPVNLRFLFESQEEIGSPGLPHLVRERADDLACDLAISADGGMWRADVPSLTTRSRGLASFELVARGPGKDLHSGRHGGSVHNPVHALARLLASLHDPDGRVAVAGFYDDVDPPGADELAALDALPFDEPAYLREVGAPAAFGEPGFGTLARQWLRPTLEINGIGGGYQGPGSKTVLPSRAVAKLTCRLVPRQRPARVIEAIRAHLDRHRPPGVEMEIRDVEEGATAYLMRDGHPVLTVAERVLEDTLGQRPVRVGMGGSVPITSVFQEALGVDTLFFSFSTADEDIHAPNEFYRPERFHAGLAAWARLWARLGATPPRHLAGDTAPPTPARSS